MEKAPEVALRSLRHCLRASLPWRELDVDASVGDPGHGKRRHEETMRHWITSFQFVADGLNYDRMAPAPQARKQSRIGQSHEGASMAVRAA